MAFQLITEQDFQSYIDKVTEKSFLQSLEMAKLLQKRGFETLYFAWVENGDTMISALAYQKKMAGGLYLEINAGPVISDINYLNDFYQGLKQYAKANGVIHLIVKPNNTFQHFDSKGNPTTEEHPELIDMLTSLGFEHDGLLTGYPGGEPDWHYVKDMTGITKDTLKKSFAPKGRSLVNKTNSFGIKTRKLDRSELQIFKDITTSTSQRREYTDKSLDYYQDFYDSFGDNAEFVVATLNFTDYLAHLEENLATITDKIQNIKGHLEENPNSAKQKKMLAEAEKQATSFDSRIQEAKEFVATYGDQDVVLAASLFIYTKQEAVYLFSGSYTEFNHFYAPVVLQEHVMNKAIELGIPSYNFLGIQGIFDGSDGVLRFKQNFNGYIVRKMGTFHYYPKPLKYKALQSLKKLLGRS